MMGRPRDPRYGWEEFADYVAAKPDCGWDVDNDDHLTAFITMMEEADDEARLHRLLADEADRQRADDLTYWKGL
jgi:hypothetical protein